MKQFFWKDKSGRGISNTFTLEEVKKLFKDNTNYDGDAIDDWADNANEGDVWENASEKVICIINLTLDVIKDLSIIIVDKMVEQGIVKDCTDTDDEEEFNAQDIIREVLCNHLRITND